MVPTMFVLSGEFPGRDPVLQDGPAVGLMNLIAVEE
jgi:hypothetical protein